MKTFFALPIAFAFLSNSIFALSLSQAIAEKKVVVDWTGASWQEMPTNLRTNGFSPKIQLVIKNQTTAPLALDLEEGYMLQPNEKGYQAMLITQQIKLNCEPNKQQKQYIYAMCTQLTNSGPGENTHYKLGEKASSALLQLAQFIRLKNYENGAAQAAVWSMTDESPVLSIESTNPAIALDLQKMVAQLKGVDLEKLKKTETRKSNVILAEFNGNKLDRNIPFSVDTNAVVSVGFYDANDQLIKPIFQDRIFTKGNHSIRYNPFPLAFINKHYSVKMMRDGELFKEYYFRQ